MAGQEDAATEPRFRVLGPLGLWADGTEISLGGDRQRVLLAHLLLNVNEPVTTERLIEAIWPRDPPASAAANVQTYVWRLRRRIPALPEGEGLLTRGARYSMALSPHRLDATEFESLVATARRSGDRARALELLDRAESLWHGSPLQDVPIAPALGGGDRQADRGAAGRHRGPARAAGRARRARRGHRRTR